MSLVDAPPWGVLRSKPVERDLSTRVLPYGSPVSANDASKRPNTFNSHQDFRESLNQINRKGPLPWKLQNTNVYMGRGQARRDQQASAAASSVSETVFGVDAAAETRFQTTSSLIGSRKNANDEYDSRLSPHMQQLRAARRQPIASPSNSQSSAAAGMLNSPLDQKLQVMEAERRRVVASVKDRLEHASLAQKHAQDTRYREKQREEEYSTKIGVSPAPRLTEPLVVHSRRRPRAKTSSICDRVTGANIITPFRDDTRTLSSPHARSRTDGSPTSVSGSASAAASTAAGACAPTVFGAVPQAPENPLCSATRSRRDVEINHARRFDACAVDAAALPSVRARLARPRFGGAGGATGAAAPAAAAAAAAAGSSASGATTALPISSSTSSSASASPYDAPKPTPACGDMYVSVCRASYQPAPLGAGAYRRESMRELVQRPKPCPIISAVVDSSRFQPRNFAPLPVT